MYLSNRDLRWAIQCGHLIVDPPPEHFNGDFDETSIDLHLGSVDEAKVWDIGKFEQDSQTHGGEPELSLGTFKYTDFSEKYLKDPAKDASQKVFLREDKVIIRPGGFLLWMTQERVGTPEKNPSLICFVNAKSTRARTGIIVHFTAPTIHAGWNGNIALEIANFGPFNFVLKENDVIAQLTVSEITSPPDMDLRLKKSQTAGQIHSTGSK